MTARARLQMLLLCAFFIYLALQFDVAVAWEALAFGALYIAALVCLLLATAPRRFL